MNQQQKAYVLTRIRDISDEKKKELVKECYVDSKRTTDKEKYDLIKTGKVKLLPYTGQEVYYVKRLFDFSEYESDAGYTKNYEKRLAALLTHVQSLCDNVMLGDADEFIKSIDAFSKMKF